jgi:hypothetical protein
MLRRACSGKRLRPSLEISVAAIEGGIEEWLSQQRTRDLTHLLADLAGVTWKSSPKCSYLAKFAPLYKIFAKFAANGVLPTKKTSLALVALHGKSPINFTGKSVVDWADEIGAILRCTFSKYRELAFGRNHAEQYRITVGSASDDERRAIDEVAYRIKQHTQYIVVRTRLQPTQPDILATSIRHPCVFIVFH